VSVDLGSDLILTADQDPTVKVFPYPFGLDILLKSPRASGESTAVHIHYSLSLRELRFRPLTFPVFDAQSRKLIKQGKSFRK
jgi:hypothetical protein